MATKKSGDATRHSRGAQQPGGRQSAIRALWPARQHPGRNPGRDVDEGTDDSPAHQDLYGHLIETWAEWRRDLSLGLHRLCQCCGGLLPLGRLANGEDRKTRRCQICGKEDPEHACRIVEWPIAERRRQQAPARADSSPVERPVRRHNQLSDIEGNDGQPNDGPVNPCKEMDPAEKEAGALGHQHHRYKQGAENRPIQQKVSPAEGRERPGVRR